MEAKERELRNYVTADNKEPFQEWIRNLGDSLGRAVIRTRLNRVRMGNLGNCRSVSGGVCELKIKFGPGYRVYFGQDGNRIILLLGGDKSSQVADIKAAKAFWRDYNAEEN